MLPELTYTHLARLTTPLGLFEHALGTEPRVEHGYCVDDVARALVVTSRERYPSADVLRLADGYLDFVLGALCDDGLMHNRRHLDGTWGDTETSNDHWGRALWALGVAAAHGQDPAFVSRAREGARRAMRARSLWPRAMAYAALGAGELLAVAPGGHGDDLSREARSLLVDARTVLGRPRPATPWPWIERRLTYANAVLPEALLVIGASLPDDTALAEGLTLLAWLVDEQEHEGHLSVVPAGGRARGDARPGYAQQPIEVAALAEASRRAYVVTGDDRWATVIATCRAWFEGANDLGMPVRDEATGGGYDGLERRAVSENQGAESTLAWLSTHQVSLMLLLDAVDR